MRKQLNTILALVGVALTTACTAATAADRAPEAGAAGRLPNSATGAQQVAVRAHDSMTFELPAITVRAGQPVQVTLKNDGQLPHDFSVFEGVSQPVKIEAPAGESASATFTIDRPGTYTFVCTVPGHGAAGMRGTITAQ